MAGLIPIAGIFLMVVLQLVVPIYLGASNGSYFWLIGIAAFLALIGKADPRGPSMNQTIMEWDKSRSIGGKVSGFIGSLVIISIIFFISRWLLAY